VWTAEELLRNLVWASADVVDGEVLHGPRGYAIRIMDKPPGASDLKQLAETGPEAGVIVHRAGDGGLVASISFGRLLRLLSTVPGARGR
jgi:hypothetical protein